jgi:hypothetical protein
VKEGYNYWWSLNMGVGVEIQVMVEARYVTRV